MIAHLVKDVKSRIDKKGEMLLKPYKHNKNRSTDLVINTHACG